LLEDSDLNRSLP